ncbi:MAG: 2'-5' RNA ligase family protein [Chitinophagaceae bacterium]|nr:2'-5' RNA ligase family protein [Chitinophagaceae bacterium]
MSYDLPYKMYYIALLCPPDVNEMVLQFKYWMRDRFACIAGLKSPAHITLIPPFWLEEAKEPELLKAFHSFTSDMSELNIELNGFSHFGKKVLFVQVKDNPATEELKNQAEDHFTSIFPANIKKDDRSFHPHVTIATPDIKPSDFDRVWEHFSKKDFAANFITRTISLLKLSPGKWNVLSQRNW